MHFRKKPTFFLGQFLQVSIFKDAAYTCHVGVRVDFLFLVHVLEFSFSSPHLCFFPLPLCSESRGLHVELPCPWVSSWM